MEWISFVWISLEIYLVLPLSLTGPELLYLCTWTLWGLRAKWLERKIKLIITYIFFSLLPNLIYFMDSKEKKTYLICNIIIFIPDDQAVSHLQRNSDNVINNSSDKVKNQFSLYNISKWENFNQINIDSPSIICRKKFPISNMLLFFFFELVYACLCSFV